MQRDFMREACVMPSEEFSDYGASAVRHIQPIELERDGSVVTNKTAELRGVEPHRFTFELLPQIRPGHLSFRESRRRWHSLRDERGETVLAKVHCAIVQRCRHHYRSRVCGREGVPTSVVY